jgi:hypothetical protein
MRSELIERRVLGAIDFVDAIAGAPVREPVLARAEGAKLVRGRGGRLIIWEANGLESHAASFLNAPADPPLQSVPLQISITEAGREFLPRRATIRLPRDTNPENANSAASIFQPIRITLFASPAAAIAPSAAIIYASVKEAGSGQPLPGALVRVLRASDSSVLARGMTEWRGRVAGEALVPVPGIPMTSFNAGDGGAVLSTAVDVIVEAIYDPELDPLEELLDPDDLEARRNTLRRATAPTTLGWGQRRPIAIEVPLQGP